MTTQRPAWLTLDYSAIRHNFAQIRALTGPDVKIFAVLKGDAYGFGTLAAARELPVGTADAFAVSDPAEARKLLPLAAGRPILLYGSTLPADIATLEEGIVPTVHSDACIEGLRGNGRRVKVMIKVDCGFGRLGFEDARLPEVLARLAAMPDDVEVLGVYSHVGSVDDPDRVALQAGRFATATAVMADLGMADAERMLASSRVLIDRQDLSLTAINPGRSLYGILEEPWNSQVDLKPVLAGITAKVIALRTLPEDRRMGYSGVGVGRGTLKVAIAPVGFGAGLPRQLDGLPVLVNGKRTTVLGLASLEHILIDLEPVGEVSVGDEVVVIGEQGGQRLTTADMASHVGMTELELVIRLASNTTLERVIR